MSDTSYRCDLCGLEFSGIIFHSETKCLFASALRFKKQLDALERQMQHLSQRGTIPPLVAPEPPADKPQSPHEKFMSELLDKPTVAARDVDSEFIIPLTAAVREADEAFERVGGGTRHYVRDCLIDALENHGLQVTGITNDKAGQESAGCVDEPKEKDGPEDMRRIASCLSYNGNNAEASAKHLLWCAAMKIDSLKQQLADARETMTQAIDCLGITIAERDELRQRLEHCTTVVKEEQDRAKELEAEASSLRQQLIRALDFHACFSEYKGMVIVDNVRLADPVKDKWLAARGDK